MPTNKPAPPAATEKVKGPASYFPSIEKTYGRPISEWKQIIRASPLTRHSDLVNFLKADYEMGHGPFAIAGAVLPIPIRLVHRRVHENRNEPTLRSYGDNFAGLAEREHFLAGPFVEVDESRPSAITPGVGW